MSACSAIASSGNPCRTPALKDAQWCLNHHPERAAERTRNARKGAAKSHERERTSPPESRDVRELTWWLFQSIAARGVEPREAAAMLAALKLLARLGPEPASEDDILAELEIRARIINGLPIPDHLAQLTRNIHTAEAIAELTRTGVLREPPPGEP